MLSSAAPPSMHSSAPSTPFGEPSISFAINPCDNFESVIRDFTRSISSDNKNGIESFCAVIQCLNPLSISHRNVFAQHIQNKAEHIIKCGINMVKSSPPNIDKTVIVCYLIEYAHSLLKQEQKSKLKKKDENERKKLFDKLNNDIRSKLKMSNNNNDGCTLSLDALSLFIETDFVSTLSFKNNGFCRSLKLYLPSYFHRFVMSGTHFMRLFNTIIHLRKQFDEQHLFQIFFKTFNQNIQISKHHIIPKHANNKSQNYDHLFTQKIVHKILRSVINISHKPQSLNYFVVNLTHFAMNRYIFKKSKKMNGEFICLLLSVYEKYKNELSSSYCSVLYNLCRDLFKDKESNKNIILFNQILIELNKLNHLLPFIKFMASKKTEFDRALIKKCGINILTDLITNKYNFNVISMKKDEQFIHLKKAFVSITLQIAKKYEKDNESVNILLSICAKAMIATDKVCDNKKCKISTIFDKNEFAKLIWCFGYVCYRNDKFWRDLFGRIKKLNNYEKNAEIVTKFAWSIARVCSYLRKYKKESLIHSPMVWCMRNCVELIGKGSIVNSFTLEQLSTMCFAISTCGKPVILGEDDEDKNCMRYYVDFFANIVGNCWEIVGILEDEPRFYLNIVCAILSFKDVLIGNDEKEKKEKNKVDEMLVDVEEDEDSDSDSESDKMMVKVDEKVKANVIEFVIHVLNQFCILKRGEKAMKDDPNIIDLLLHIAAEFGENGVMIKQINKLLQILCDLEVEIEHECAFNIVTTLSRIPFDLELTANKYKVTNDLCLLIVKEFNRQSRRNKDEYLALDWTLGLCFAICTFSTDQSIKYQWDSKVIKCLNNAAKHYVNDFEDEWKDQNPLLKKSLQSFLAEFDKK